MHLFPHGNLPMHGDVREFLKRLYIAMSECDVETDLSDAMPREILRPLGNCPSWDFTARSEEGEGRVSLAHRSPLSQRVSPEWLPTLIAPQLPQDLSPLSLSNQNQIIPTTFTNRSQFEHLTISEEHWDDKQADRPYIPPAPAPEPRRSSRRQAAAAAPARRPSQIPPGNDQKERLKALVHEAHDENVFRHHGAGPRGQARIAAYPSYLIMQVRVLLICCCCFVVVVVAAADYCRRLPPSLPPHR